MEVNPSTLNPNTFFDLESLTLTLTLTLESLSPNPSVITLEPSMSSVGVCFSSPRFWLAEASFALERTL